MATYIHENGASFSDEIVEGTHLPQSSRSGRSPSLSRWDRSSQTASVTCAQIQAAPEVDDASDNAVADPARMFLRRGPTQRVSDHRQSALLRH